MCKRRERGRERKRKRKEEERRSDGKRENKRESMKKGNEDRGKETAGEVRWRDNLFLPVSKQSRPWPLKNIMSVKD